MAQASKIDYNLIFKASIAVGVYFLVIKPLTEKLGLKASSAEKEAEKILEQQETKINIWQGTEAVKRAAGANSTIKLLSYSSAASKADGIQDSFSFYNDNEERIYAIFRDLNAQTQVASLVDQYRLRHKADLLNALKSNLSTTEVNEITKIIDQKPSGVTKK
jgi:hypothetical protein